MNLTPEQQAAVNARGGSLTLSAAAGSGKTRVLTERAVARMLDPEHPIDADRLLIVTFTRAAAAEMKSRIVERFSSHLRENPQDERARRQKMLLGRAQIGTIDALCTSILRNHFQAVGIPANFRIGEENEIAAMQAEALTEVLEAAYAADLPAFRELTRLFSDAGKDGALENAVLQVLSFARSHPYYRRWLQEKLTLYRDFSAPCESIWAKLLFQNAKSRIRLEKERVETVLEKITADIALSPYDPVFHHDLAVLCRLEEMVNAGNWDGCLDVLESYAPLRLPSPRSLEKERRDAIRAVRDHAKDFLKKELPQKIFPAREAEFSEDVLDLLPKVDCLFSLVHETDLRLQNEKMRTGVLDFSDLEQLVCELLTEENGALKPLAAECAACYDEVMVDESQDINEVQNRILSALSAQNGLFCVGDVKQCIYRFRMACPEIFLERVAAGCPYDGHHFPATLYLNGNFRTVPEITNLINLVFSALMSREAGDVDYDETQQLRALGTFPDGGERGVDLCLIHRDAAEDGENESISAEALWVAEEIRRLLQTAQVAENETMRPARPSDIAILLRSPRSSGDFYRRALENAGMDASLTLDNGFLDAPEVETVLNALTALQNPMREVELLGMLTSPIGSFSDDEIAAMRLKTPKGSLYAALCSAAETEKHAAEFLQQFEMLRRLSMSLPPAELMGELYRQTGFDLLCRRRKHGEECAANLTLLQHYAAQSMGDAVPSLDGFLRKIEQLRRSGRDLAGAFTGQKKDAVSILSIHKSKGLEWPIVFVCGLGKVHSFYRHDLAASTILNSDCGFASVRRDPKTRRQFPSVPLLAVRAQKQRDLLSEELRVLYVAMTRAKERLILTGTVKDSAAALLSAAQNAEGRKRLSPAAVCEGKTYLDWLLPALSIGQNLTGLAQSGMRCGGLRITCVESTPTVIPAAEMPNEVAAPIPDEAAAQQLAERMSRRYAFALAAALPAKLSVSALTHSDSTLRFTAKPVFLDTGRSDGTAYGTAMHRFLQLCSLASASENPEKEIARLCRNGAFTLEEAGGLNRRQLRQFFAGPLATRMLRADRVLREYRMLAPASASPLAVQYALPEGESTMLQGVADCILIEGEAAILIDYKTDHVPDDAALLDRYRPQLLLYRDLLSHQLGLPVREGYLYSFSLGHEIRVF